MDNRDTLYRRLKDLGVDVVYSSKCGYAVVSYFDNRRCQVWFSELVGTGRFSKGRLGYNAEGFYTLDEALAYILNYGKTACQ